MSPESSIATLPEACFALYTGLFHNTFFIAGTTEEKQLKGRIILSHGLQATRHSQRAERDECWGPLII